MYHIGQLIELNVGNKWLPGKIIMFGLEPDRWCVELDEIWRDEKSYWVSDIYLKPVLKNDI